VLLRSSAPPISIHAFIPPAEGSSFVLDYGSPGTAVVSADGSRIAYAANRQGQILLWVRDLNSTESRPIPGTEGAQYPFWSPDG